MLIVIGFDLLMAVLMFLLGHYFYTSKGHAANFLTGYNMRTLEERKKYDEEALCKCYGKRMMIMAFPFLGGAVIDGFLTGVGCILAWIIWIVLFVFLLLARIKREKENSSRN